MEIKSDLDPTLKDSRPSNPSLNSFERQYEYGNTGSLNEKIKHTDTISF